MDKNQNKIIRDKHHKNIILQTCNALNVDDLITIVQLNEITIEEFKHAGLDQSKVKQIENSFITREQEKHSKSEKENLIDKVIRKKVSADEIKLNINENKYTFEDLAQAGISAQTINSLKHYCSSNRITIFRNISQLLAMEEGRTDVYFIGLPGTGKSTMLSGLLHVANRKGVLMPDTYNNDGSIYQTQLISDLNRGVLPNATAEGSYNYIALSLKDEDGAKHPLNVVEVPGELYVDMFNNSNVAEFLTYINNSNKKVLIFVIDSLAHDTGYNDSKNQLDQNLVYVNILNMFKKNGVLEQTDAIYLVVNKFDGIKETLYPFDNRPAEELALDFLNSEFKSLINNCKDARDETNNKFTIAVLPFSIGNVSYVSIIDHFATEYADIVINNLMIDSFVVKGAWWTRIFKL